MTTSIGLYYPFIRFRDDNWLKASALYWDRMGRIVPAGSHRAGSLGDSDTVRALLAHGYVINYDPDWDDRELAGRPFLVLVANHGGSLRARYGSSRNSGGSLEGYVLHPKMDHRPVAALVGEGLATSEGSRVLMHPRLAGVYMTALAEVMASRRRVQPLTDGVADHLAMAGLTTPRLAATLLDDATLARGQPSGAEVTAWMAGIAVRYVLPANIDAVPVRSIVTFRERYPEERARFQHLVGSLLQDLNSIEELDDTAAILHHLEATYEKTIAPELRELDGKLKRRRSIRSSAS